MDIAREELLVRWGNDDGEGGIWGRMNPKLIPDGCHFYFAKESIEVGASGLLCSYPRFQGTRDGAFGIFQLVHVL